MLSCSVLLDLEVAHHPVVSLHHTSFDSKRNVLHHLFASLHHASLHHASLHHVLAHEDGVLRQHAFASLHLVVVSSMSRLVHHPFAFLHLASLAAI